MAAFGALQVCSLIVGGAKGGLHQPDSGSPRGEEALQLFDLLHGHDGHQGFVKGRGQGGCFKAPMLRRQLVPYAWTDTAAERCITRSTACLKSMLLDAWREMNSRTMPGLMPATVMCCFCYRPDPCETFTRSSTSERAGANTQAGTNHVG